MNPFKPGSGHMPPHLAGRRQEKDEFLELLNQKLVLKNAIITGLRGIGKTVLLESFKPLANLNGWLWAGTDCSEAVSVNEDSMAIRIITDLALITSGVIINEEPMEQLGFHLENIKHKVTRLDYQYLVNYYTQIPGLSSDKLKATLELAWNHIKNLGLSGIIFAYDEAQTLQDHAEDKQYPLSLLLDVFNSIQKKEIPFMLVLTGLPMLQANLVETRTYSERLFRVLELDRLTPEESKEAILIPFQTSNDISINDSILNLIIENSGGYPFFIQYICREIYDILAIQTKENQKLEIPIEAILSKLDSDFFTGRWAKATERERELMSLIAVSNKTHFRVNEIVEISKISSFKKFERSNISQMFKKLIQAGLIYRNKQGSYSFAVPLMDRYIRRYLEKQKIFNEMDHTTDTTNLDIE